MFEATQRPRADAPAFAMHYLKIVGATMFSKLAARFLQSDTRNDILSPHLHTKNQQNDSAATA
jgi:hypothetical protein